jgi:hypothetical protein
MSSKIAVLLALLVFVAGSVQGQTDTPTPTITPTPNVTLVLTIPRSDMYSSLATAAANVNRLPDEIRRPGGQSLIPSPDVSQLFAWAKWLFSLNTAQELLGQTLAPIGIELFIIMNFVVILTAIYFLINLIVLIIKGVIWIINQILKIVPFW